MKSELFDHQLIAEALIEAENPIVQLKYRQLALDNPPQNEEEVTRLFLFARELTGTKDIIRADNKPIGVRDPYPDDYEGTPIAPHISGVLWILLCVGMWTFLTSHKWVSTNFWTHLCLLVFVSVTAHLVFTFVQKNCDEVN